MSKKADERNKDIKMLREEKFWTLEQIAELYGISRERVRQILGNTGRGFIRRKREKEIQEHSNLTNREICEKIGVPRGSLFYYGRSSSRHALEPGSLCAQGAEAETIVSKKLMEHGIGNKLMPHHHPFDILLDNGLHIDVKFRNSSNNKSNYPNYHVNPKKTEIIDYYAILLPNKEDVYIIPYNLSGTIISITKYPKRKNKWDFYKNNFDILKDGQP